MILYITVLYIKQNSGFTPFVNTDAFTPEAINDFFLFPDLFEFNTGKPDIGGSTKYFKKDNTNLEDDSDVAYTLLIILLNPHYFYFYL